MYTGIETMFVAYLSPPPTLYKHEMYIYGQIMKNKVRNNEQMEIVIIFQ